MRKVSRILDCFLCLCLVVPLLTAVFLVEAKGKDRQYELSDPVLLADYGDVEVWGEKKYAFTIPCDRMPIFELQIRNTGDKNQYFGWDNDVKITGDHLSKEPLKGEKVQCEDLRISEE